MGKKLRAFMLGMTNPYNPIDYSDVNQLGEISKRIDKKIIAQRKSTRAKIDKITTESGRTEAGCTAAY